MMKFKNQDGGCIVDGLIKTIQDNKDFLSEVDGKIGDGDHGINMNKGFTMCGDKLKGTTYNMSEAFATLSATLMEDIGGSMGPLYGVIFDEMSVVSEGKEEIDAAVFDEMLSSAVAAVQDIGSAKKGDKTLLDTLIPASEAFSAAVAANRDFAECMEEMRKNAKEGWQATENMVAKIGRASRLGERSRGVLDAGATSCYLMLDSIATSVQELIK